MKTLPKSIVYLLLVAIVAVYAACKKDQPETTTVTEDATIVADTVATPVDTTAIDTVKEEANDVASGATAKKTWSPRSGTAKNSSGKTTAATAENGKSLKGYSAPDGTDAENKDGDQYTKNDNRRMPSGSNSMK